MKELNSLKKGPPQLLLRHPLRIVSQQGSPPTARQHEAVQRFFDNCGTKLSRIVSGPESIDGLSSMPEVAFMGRSNVGKSSLLNALLYPRSRDKSAIENRDYARVANNPGFTKTLNFYTCGRQLRVIDMPGYGYGSKSQQGDLIRSYLENQRSLRRVYLLASCQQGLTELDQMALDILGEVGIPWQLVYTKLDKLITKPEKLQQNVDQKQSFLSKFQKNKKPQFKETLSLQDTATINNLIESALPQVEMHPSGYQQVIGTSASKRLNYLGIPELRTSIFQACGLLRHDKSQ